MGQDKDDEKNVSSVHILSENNDPASLQKTYIREVTRTASFG